MTHDHWKATNPADEYLGSTHDDGGCDCGAATDGKWAGIHEPGCASNYARAIRRGRHLTETEKLHNLADAMDEADREHGDRRFKATAEKIRQAAG